MIFGVDIVEMAVLTAMGESISATVHKGISYFATHNLHSSRDGLYKEIVFSDELEKHIIRKCLYKKVGDEVHYFANAADALGIIFMKYDSEEQMAEFLANMNEHIQINLQ
jgi:hypothetical protein